MVIHFNKNTDTNISSIKVSNTDYEIVNVVAEGSMGWAVDEDTHTITFLGSTDTQISFKDQLSLEIYLTQIETALGIPYSPFINGIANDPHYDKIPTGTIQQHQYENTDIEKELINGSN